MRSIIRHRSRYLLGLVSIGFMLGFFAGGHQAPAQEEPDHAKHHQAQTGNNGSSDGQDSGEKNDAKKGKGKMGKGKMGKDKMGKGKMGKGKMGKGKDDDDDDDDEKSLQSEELYPHLMSLPEMTPEDRARLEAQAHQRMVDGTSLMSEGFNALSSAASDDYVGMQRAASALREGVTQFETGLATQRAIVEGVAPRNEALRWLKQELSLAPPITEDTEGMLWGMGLFHTFVMFLLIAFAITMVAMYYFKMRRASTLLKALATGEVGDESLAQATANAAAPSADKPDTLASIETDCCPSGTLLASDASAQGLLPFVRRKKCNLKVVDIFQETPDVKTFRLICCHGGAIPFSYLPGQFLTVTMPVGEKPIRRSYTMSSSPTQGYYCEITVKREEKGQGSRYLHDVVGVGDELVVEAPSGRFTFTGKENDTIVLIGGGVGITPMMSVTRALLDMGWDGEIYFIAAARDPEYFIFRSELQRLQERYPNLHLFAAMSRLKEPVDGYRSGRLSKELLVEWVPEITTKRIHICGSPSMMDSTKQMLSELGVSQENIYSENFGSSQKPQAKPQPEQASSAASPDATVSFTTSETSTDLRADESVLEASERIGVNIDYSCRVGVCGVCRVKKLAGEVTQEVTDGLEPGDEEAGIILACQAKSKEDVSVEA